MSDIEKELEKVQSEIQKILDKQARRGAANKERVWTPEQREKVGTASRKRRASAETRAKLTAVLKQRWQDPMFREREMQRRRSFKYLTSEETKRLISQSKKLSWYQKGAVKRAHHAQIAKRVKRGRTGDQDRANLARMRQCRKPITEEARNNLRIGLAAMLDHDHKTDFVRALLCSGCNSGYTSDDAEFLAKKLAYVQQHTQQPSMIPYSKLARANKLLIKRHLYNVQDGCCAICQKAFYTADVAAMFKNTPEDHLEQTKVIAYLQQFFSENNGH